MGGDWGWGLLCSGVLEAGQVRVEGAFGEPQKHVLFILLSFSMWGVVGMTLTCRTLVGFKWDNTQGCRGLGARANRRQVVTNPLLCLAGGSSSHGMLLRGAFLRHQGLQMARGVLEWVSH
jgi:hypothetical protein